MTVVAYGVDHGVDGLLNVVKGCEEPPTPADRIYLSYHLRLSMETVQRLKRLLQIFSSLLFLLRDLQILNPSFGCLVFLVLILLATEQALQR